MRQTICQNCQAANKREAIVCVHCGTRLDHAEDGALARLHANGFFRNLAMAPVRLVHYFAKRLMLLAGVLLLTLLFGGGFLLLLVFAPLSWPDYKAAPQSAVTNAAAQDAQRELDANGAARFDPGSAAAFGNLLLFPPQKQRYSSQPEAPTPPRPYRLRGRFCALKDGDNQYEFTFTGTIYERIPWRLTAKFSAVREKDGAFEPDGFLLGQLPIPRSLYLMLLRRLLPALNPQEQLSALLSRLLDARMELRNNRHGTFVVRAIPARR